MTGYNPELSDRDFAEKQSMKGGFADSPIRLNRYLAEAREWTRKEIECRADELAQLAMKIWPRPQISEAALERYAQQAPTSAPTERSMEELLEGIPEETLEVFQLLRRQILGLDPTIREEPKKHYLAFKADTNFADVSPLKSKLQVWLNLRPDELNDPLGLARDVSSIGHWGNGDVEIELSSRVQIPDVMNLIVQSLDKQRDLVPV